MEAFEVVKFIVSLGVVTLCIKLLCSRLDRNEAALDRLGEKVDSGFAKVRELFVTKERCQELRDNKAYKGDK